MLVTSALADPPSSERSNAPATSPWCRGIPHSWPPLGAFAHRCSVGLIDLADPGTAHPIMPPHASGEGMTGSRYRLPQTGTRP